MMQTMGIFKQEDLERNQPPRWEQILLPLVIIVVTSLYRGIQIVGDLVSLFATGLERWYYPFNRVYNTVADYMDTVFAIVVPLLIIIVLRFERKAAKRSASTYAIINTGGIFVMFCTILVYGLINNQLQTMTAQENIIQFTMVLIMLAVVFGGSLLPLIILPLRKKLKNTLSIYLIFLIIYGIYTFLYNMVTGNLIETAVGLTLGEALWQTSKTVLLALVVFLIEGVITYQPPFRKMNLPVHQKEEEQQEEQQDTLQENISDDMPVDDENDAQAVSETSDSQEDIPAE